jgi:hypothetical protein
MVVVRAARPPELPGPPMPGPESCLDRVGVIAECHTHLARPPRTPTCRHPRRRQRISFRTGSSLGSVRTRVACPRASESFIKRRGALAHRSSEIASPLATGCLEFLFVTNKNNDWCGFEGLAEAARPHAATSRGDARSIRLQSAWEIGRFSIKHPGLLKLACGMVELQLIPSADRLSQTRPDDHLFFHSGASRAKKAPVSRLKQPD